VLEVVAEGHTLAVSLGCAAQAAVRSQRVLAAHRPFTVDQAQSGYAD
jgi:hypothetical protein